MALKDCLDAWIVGDAYPIWWQAGPDRTLGGYITTVLDLTGTRSPGPIGGRGSRRARRSASPLAPRSALAGAVGRGDAQGLDFLEARLPSLMALSDRRAGRRYAGRRRRRSLPITAFVLLALAAAARVGGHRGDVGRERRLSTSLRPIPLGRLAASGDATCGTKPPNMHLLRSGLGPWVEAGWRARWSALAEGSAALALDHF